MSAKFYSFLLRPVMTLITGVALVLVYTISLVPIDRDHLFDPAWVEYAIVGLIGALLGLGADLAMTRSNQSKQ